MNMLIYYNVHSFILCVLSSLLCLLKCNAFQFCSKCLLKNCPSYSLRYSSITLRAQKEVPWTMRIIMPEASLVLLTAVSLQHPLAHVNKPRALIRQQLFNVGHICLYYMLNYSLVVKCWHCDVTTAPCMLHQMYLKITLQVETQCKSVLNKGHSLIWSMYNISDLLTRGK